MNTNFNTQPLTPGVDDAGTESLSAPNEKPNKGNEIHIDKIKYYFNESQVVGRQILIKAGKTPVECFSLYRRLRGCDFTKIDLDEVVNLKDPEIENFMTKTAEVVNYVINNEPEMTDQKKLTATKILELAGIDAEEFYLVQVKEDGSEVVYAYNPQDLIIMHWVGMKFVSREWDKIVDIEEYGKACKPVPIAKEYLIKVDKNKYPWNDRFILGKQVIGLEIKTNVNDYNLLKFYSNSPKPVPVGPDEKIDLTQNCLVRFVVQPKTQSDGERKSFSLPEEDTDFLNQISFPWEAYLEGSCFWLLVNEYAIPDGYNTTKATVALMIPPTYPASQIDMAYFFPQLAKKNGKPINAITNQTIDAKVFQRWSRHRKSGEWKPGVDCVATHLELVNNWLENDLKR
jgi:Prokaryotic E2 family E/Multiubiquitin